MNQQFTDLVKKVKEHCEKERINQERFYTVNTGSFTGIFYHDDDDPKSCGLILEKGRWFTWCTAETARAPINYETAQKIADSFFTSGSTLSKKIVVDYIK